MSHTATILRGLSRIELACRPWRVPDPEGEGRVSAHQATILAALDETDPVMVGELADYLGVTASTMSLTLQRLERAGWVRRERDPVDRRVTNVRLTAAGARIRDARAALDPERVADLLALVPAARREEAIRGLSLLVDAADALVRRSSERVAARVEG